MMKYTYLFVFFLLCSLTSAAQKTVEGIHFNACIGKENLAPDFYKGKFLVIDFWATWCAPCISSLSHIKELEEHYKADTHVVFATMTDESKDVIEKFLQKKAGIYLTAFPLIDTSLQTLDYYGIVGIPKTLVFAPEGNLVFSGYPREITTDTLDQIFQGKIHWQDPTDRKAVAGSIDYWKLAEESRYFVRTLPAADTLEEPLMMGRTSEKEFLYIGENRRIKDHIMSLSNLRAFEISTNDETRWNKKIDLQANLIIPYLHIDGPHNAVFPANDAKKELLHILENNYQFTTCWKKQTLSVVYLEIEDAQKLKQNRTILNSDGSSIDLVENKLVVIGFDLGQLAESIGENPIFPMPVLVKKADYNQHYDFTIDMTSLESLQASLAACGLRLSAPATKKVNQLYIHFYE